MMKNIYGVTIAVKNLDQAVKKYEAFLGMKASYSMEVEAEKTLARFVYQRDELLDVGFDSHAEAAHFQLPGGPRIVLMTSSDENSVLGKFLATKGEGLLMVSLEVDDAKKEADRIRQQGVQLVLEHNAAGNFGEANFAHPKALNGVQFELFEPKGSYKH